MKLLKSGTLIELKNIELVRPFNSDGVYGNGVVKGCRVYYKHNNTVELKAEDYQELLEHFELQNNPKPVVKEVGDSHHTMQELYEHRVALFLRLCEEGTYSRGRSFGKVSYKVDETDPDWLIVYLQLPEGQISYHVPNTNEIAERVMAIGKPVIEDIFDGHTSEDTLKRLNRTT